MTTHSKPTPTSTESEFRIDELFFSTTDRRGVILSGNEVFVRVSGYTEQELLGQPHSIIRHPDMPRVVFKLLWEYIERNRPIVAYVKNMSKSGSYYWVLALVTPLPEGYLSVRIKPTSKFVPIVKELYLKLLETERVYGDRGESRKQGIEAARQQLLTFLNENGFDDYDAFMRAVIQEEMASRDAVLGDEQLKVIPELWELEQTLKSAGCSAKRSGAVTEIFRGCKSIYEPIDKLFEQLENFILSSQDLERRAQFVVGLTQGFRLVSLNAAVESAKQGEIARSLGVVADHMSGSAADIGQVVSELVDHIHQVVGYLRDTTFGCAAMRLQLETIMVFCRQIAASPTGAEQESSKIMSTMIQDLETALKLTFAQAIASLLALRKEAQELEYRAEGLRKTVITLRFTQICGSVEAYRLGQLGSFAVIFEEVKGQLESAMAELSGLNGTIEQIYNQVRRAPELETQTLRALDRVQQQLGELAAH